MDERSSTEGAVRVFKDMQLERCAFGGLVLHFADEALQRMLGRVMLLPCRLIQKAAVAEAAAWVCGGNVLVINPDVEAVQADGTQSAARTDVLTDDVLFQRGLVDEAAVAVVAEWVCRDVLVIYPVAEDIPADGTLDGSGSQR